MTRKQRNIAIQNRAAELIARYGRNDPKVKREITALLEHVGKTMSDLNILRQLDIIEFVARKSRDSDPKLPRVFGRWTNVICESL